MELPPKPSKAELRGRKAKWSKKLSHKKKRYYPLKDHNVHTSAAWIIYHHNGPKKTNSHSYMKLSYISFYI